MDANTARWAQHLMDSYRDEGGVTTSDEPGLPSKPEIAALCLQIMQLLFPGYHDSGSIGKLELATLTSERVSSLAEDLRRAFLAVLPGKDDAGATANEVASRYGYTTRSVRSIAPSRPASDSDSPQIGIDFGA